jgi:hypothetical protein
MFAALVDGVSSETMVGCSHWALLWQLCQIASVAAVAPVASQGTTPGVVDALINNEGIPKAGDIGNGGGREGGIGAREHREHGNRVFNSFIS